MDIANLISLVIQNGFLTVFASTVLYFMIKAGNHYLESLSNKTHTLPDDLVVNLVRAIVWYHSRGKLRHIESILIENNIERRKEEITRKVRNALEERTMVYLDYFNTLNTNIKRLGDFYGNSFEMNPFFEEVMKIVLRPYESPNSHDHEIVIKLKDIAEVMYFYQEKANTKIEDELQRISNSNK